MPSEEPLDDRCAARVKRGEGYCESHPVSGANRCRMHGGTSDGAPAGNAHALEHGLRSRRPAGELYPQLPESGQERVDDLVAAYVERWGWDPDDPRIESRLVDVCVDVWRRWRAKDILAADGPSEERVVGVNDLGEPIVAVDEHHLNKQVSRIDSDIRQNLRDLAPEDETDVVRDTAAELLAAAGERLRKRDRDEPETVDATPANSP
jgi:hypothetical protein